MKKLMCKTVKIKQNEWPQMAREYYKRLSELKQEVLTSITVKMKGKGSFEFDEAINLSYADEEMRLLRKEGKKILLVT